MTGKIGFLRWAMTGAAAIAAVSASAARAQEAAPASASETRRFDVPAQPLTQAALRFSEQAGVQLVFDTPVADGVSASAVQGELTIGEAMDRLLAGTGRRWRWLNERTITIEAAVSADGARVLGPVRVEGAAGGAGSAAGAGAPGRGEGIASLGGIRGRQADEAVGYRARVATIASGAPTALEDIPRSISVLTHEQLQQQNINDIGEALRKLPGVTMTEGTNTPVESGSSIYVRGERLTHFQVDGGAAQRFNVFDGGLIDIGPYERVELVRGPNGVFIGGNNPAGTINLVRKRPGTQPSNVYTVSVGSWNDYMAGLDVSRPNVLGSGIGFRAVATYHDQDFFYDRASRSSFLLYGIFDIPLTEAVNIELGGQYSAIRDDASYIGLPRYIDGPLMPFPRETNLAPDWVHQYVDTTEVFSRFNVDVSEKWQVQGGVTYTSSKLDSVNYSNQATLYSLTGAPFPDTESSSRVFAQIQNYDRSDLLMDLKLTGQFETFGLIHNVYAQIDRTDSIAIGGTDQNPVDYFFHRVFSIDELLPEAVPMPAFRPPSAIPQRITSHRLGISLADTISWRNLVDLSIGLRRFSYEETFTRIAPEFSYVGVEPYIERPAWVPTYSAVLKPIERLRLYASLSQGTRDQSQSYTKEGPLGPATYENKEIGIKYGTDRLLASLTLFDQRTDNTGVAIEPYDLSCGPLGTSICFYVGGATTKSRGIDVEVAGRLAPSLDIVASFNYNKAETIGEHVPLETQAPTKMGKLYANWRPPFVPGLSVDFGLTAQASTYQSGSAGVTDPVTGEVTWVPYDYTQEGYVVFDLGFHYDFNAFVNLGLRIENVTDEFYFSTVSSNFVAPPRSVMLTLRVRDAGAAEGSAYLPEGYWLGLAGWYGGFDVGYHTTNSVSSQSDGVRSDGTRADWAWDTKADLAIWARLGYELGDHLRAELEGGYRPGQLKSVQGTGVAPTGLCSTRQGAAEPPGCTAPPGNFDIYSALGTLIYDPLGREGLLQPFIGVGLGIARSSIDVSGRFDGVEGAAGANKQGLGFGWQALSGIGVKVTDRITLDFAYRYFRAENVKWEIYSITPMLGTFSGDYADHSATAGLRVKF